MLTALIIWAIIGLISGWVAGQLVRGYGFGLVGNLIIGLIGAIVGGLLFNMLGQPGVTGLNIWSIVVAIIGAVVFLWVANLISRRGA